MEIPQGNTMENSGKQNPQSGFKSPRAEMPTFKWLFLKHLCSKTSGPRENASQSFPNLSGQILDRSDRFSYVLNCRNQEVLDRLFNQPSPASTFEAMSVGSVSKTTFHQMLPAFAIKLGSLGIGLSTRSIQEGLIAMTFKAAARFGSGAELNLPRFGGPEAQSKMRESVKEKKVQKRYHEEFKRQAVELVIHSGRYCRRMNAEKPCGVSGSFGARRYHRNDLILLIGSKLWPSPSMEPRLRAASNPAFVRSRSIALSNSANAPTICIIIRPGAVVVSIASPKLLNPASASLIRSMIIRRSRSERESRSRRETMRTSPFRS
jgi:hypothetical protein